MIYFILLFQSVCGPQHQVEESLRHEIFQSGCQQDSSDELYHKNRYAHLLYQQNIPSSNDLKILPDLFQTLSADDMESRVRIHLKLS